MRKMNKVNINQLSALIELTNKFVVSGGEDIESQLNFIDTTEKWVDIIDSYNNKANEVIKDLKIKFDGDGNIISGSEAKFKKALEPLVKELYEIEPPLSYVEFKQMAPSNLNIEQFRFVKKYLVK